MTEQNQFVLAREIGVKMLSALDQLGIGYRTRNGDWWGVRFSRIGPTPDGNALVFEVDMNPGSLPRGVSSDDLTNPKVVNHLSAVVGMRVLVDSRRGVRYVVVLRKTDHRLPRKVALERNVAAAMHKTLFSLGIGFTKAGHWWEPWSRIVHVLVAGQTGWGKSTFLRSMVYQVLSASPREARVILADLDAVSFAPLEGIPHLVEDGLVEGDPDQLMKVLSWVVYDEMPRRAALYKSSGEYPESVEEYNALELERLPHIVVVIDEVNGWLGSGRAREIKELLLSIARRGRKYGVHLVLAGQDVRAVAMDKGIRSQLGAVVQFRAGDEYESRMTVGDGSAASLKVPGRAIARMNGRKRIVQTYWVSKEQLLQRARMLQGTEPQPLTPLEIDMVRYAVTHLDGRFPITSLSQAFADRVSEWQIRKTAERWERRGWLLPPQGPGGGREARRVSPELLKLVAGERAHGKAMSFQSVGRG